MANIKKRAVLLALFLGLAAVFVAALWLAVARRAPLNANTTEGTITVVASFYPLAEFAARVGGDRVRVVNITPPGTEPHEYEPTPLEIAGVYKANLFLYNGNGIDGWADRLADDIRSKGVIVSRMSDQVDVLETDTDDEGEAYDPHIWLDPRNAQKIIGLTAKLLSDADPDGAGAYEANRDAYIQTLTELDQAYRSGLEQCASRTIVTTHNAFRYLARQYALDTEYILGLSPDEDPSPRRLAEIADLAKVRGIKVIFFETLVSPKIAQTIANEIGAETLVLNPLEGLTEEELRAGKSYVSVMLENLSNLKTALTCQENSPS